MHGIASLRCAALRSYSASPSSSPTQQLHISQAAPLSSSAVPPSAMIPMPQPLAAAAAAAGSAAAAGAPSTAAASRLAAKLAAPVLPGGVPRYTRVLSTCQWAGGSGGR